MTPLNLACAGMRDDDALPPLLQAMCGHLGVGREEVDRIIDTRTLRIADVDFALHLNDATRQLEFYADCGRPAPWEEQALFRHLLEDSLCSELPGLAFGLHPLSRHVVARGSLYMPAVDPQGLLWLALMLTAVARVQELRERFDLTPGPEG